MPLNTKHTEQEERFNSYFLEEGEKLAEDVNTTTPALNSESLQESVSDEQEKVEPVPVFTPAILDTIQSSRTEMLNTLFSHASDSAAKDKKLVGGLFDRKFETSTPGLETPGSLKDKFLKLR